MTLALDGASEARQATCDHCGRDYVTVTSLVTRGGDTYCVARTALHDHDGHEAWLDIVFGTFEDGAEDHVTFGCRVGPVEGSPEPAATAVTAAQPYGESSFWGQKLTRAQALDHELIDEFWAVVDFLLEHEPEIQHHVYHHP